MKNLIKLDIKTEAGFMSLMVNDAIYVTACDIAGDKYNVKLGPRKKEGVPRVLLQSEKKDDPFLIYLDVEKGILFKDSDSNIEIFSDPKSCFMIKRLSG